MSETTKRNSNPAVADISNCTECQAAMRHILQHGADQHIAAELGAAPQESAALLKAKEMRAAWADAPRSSWDELIDLIAREAQEHQEAISQQRYFRDEDAAQWDKEGDDLRAKLEQVTEEVGPTRQANIMLTRRLDALRKQRDELLRICKDNGVVVPDDLR